MVNKNNIEELLFDRYEGNLSDQMERELAQFIEKNPEYKEDDLAWKHSRIERSKVANFPNSKKLMKKSFFLSLRGISFLLLIGGILSFWYFYPSESNKKNEPSSFKKTDTQKTNHRQPLSQTNFKSKQNDKNTQKPIQSDKKVKALKKNQGNTEEKVSKQNQRSINEPTNKENSIIHINDSITKPIIHETLVDSLDNIKTLPSLNEDNSNTKELNTMSKDSTLDVIPTRKPVESESKKNKRKKGKVPKKRVRGKNIKIIPIDL